MADREKEINSVKALLRAVLQSNKGGVSRHRLLGEYRGITGDLLPYRELGFENVEDFMRAIPDCVTFGHNKDGEPVYLPVADAKSAHIQRMVSAQKGKKARRGKHLQGNSRRPGKSKKLARSPRARFSSSWQRNSPSSYGSTSRQQHGQGKPTQGRSSYSHGSGTPGRYSSLEVTINTDRAGQILQTVNRFPNTAYWMPAPSIPLITQWQIPPQTIHSDGTASDSSSQQPTPPSGSPFLTQNSPVGSEASPPGGTSGAPGTHLTWPVVRTEPVETLPACREKLNLPHLDPRSSAQNTSTPRSNALSLQYGHFPPVRDWSCLPGRPQLPMSPQFLPASELHSPTLMGSFATSAMSTSSPPGYMVPPRHFSTPYMLTTPPAGNSGYLPRVPVPITSVGCSPYANMTARSPPQYSYTPSLTSVSHLSVSSPVTTVPHPMICNLQSALRNEFEKQQKSSPGQVPVSVRVGILQLRFMTLLPRFGSTIEELQNVYKLQSATIESERYRSLSAVIGSPSLAESVNSHFDQQHHSLMDRVEASLGLLESRKTKKSSCPAVPTGISIATEETVRSRERSRFMPLNPLAVRVMSKWYDNNKEHPYPSYGTCEVLAKAGGITVEQVKKWFANRRMRSRNTKPLSEIAKRRYRNRSKSQNADSILVNTDRGRDV